MKWFLDRKIRTKLLAAFGALLALMAFVGVFAIERMHGLEAISDEINDRWLPDIEELGVTRGDIRELQIHEMTLLLTSSEQDVSREEKRVAELIAKITPSISEHEKDPYNEEERSLGEGARVGWDAYLAGHAAVVDLVRKKDLAAAQALVLGAQGDRYAVIVQKLDELIAMHVRMSDERTKTAGNDFRASRAWIVAVLATAILSGMGLAVFIARVIAQSLSGVISTVGRASEGDLTVRIPLESKDEIGETAAAINGFLDSLHEAMVQVARASNQVASASEQLSSSSEALSNGTQEQAASLEETAASLEEMTGSVKENAENARSASALASGSKAQDSASATSAMVEINKASKRIGEIIGVIDEIAFQTNLLALNAAVEAARAGEQGRGFAVVAAEVRTLAQRSATAAKEIKALIGDTVQKVEDGSALVRRVTDFMSQIANANGEQATGIEQLNRAISQMDEVVQSNSAQTEELSATASELAAQAEELRGMVDRFQLSAPKRGPFSPREMSASPAQRPAAPAKAPLLVSREARRGRPMRARRGDSMPAPASDFPAPRDGQAGKHARSAFHADDF